MEARESRLSCMDDGKPQMVSGGEIGLPASIISKDKSVFSLHVSEISRVSITSLPQNRVPAAPLFSLQFHPADLSSKRGSPQTAV